MLGIGFVQQVVHADGDFQLPLHAVAGVQRQHAKTAAGPHVAAHDIALVLGVAVLRGNQSPQGARRPRALGVIQAQARFQRGHLWQGRAIAAVAPPGVGHRGLGRPGRCQFVAAAQLETGGAGINVACLAGVAGVVEQDKVAHHPGVGRGPELPVLPLPVGTHVQLGGFFWLQGGKDVACFARNELPVIRKTLHMPQANVGGGPAGQRLLPAHKAAGQGAFVALVGAGWVAVIPGLGTVQAQAAHPQGAGRGLPAQFAKQAQVGKLGIAHPWLVQVAHAHAAAPFVRVALQVQADVGGQRRGRLQGRCDAAPGDDALDVAGHGHLARGQGAALEVVHQVVGLVAVNLRLDFAQPGRDVLLLQPQAQAVAAKLGAVHAAGGRARPAVSSPGAQLHQGIGIGCPAQGGIGIPFVPAGRDGGAVTVLVVLAV